MSYSSEHKRLRPVLDMANKYDIAENPAKEALFESLLSGFQIWCTPDDHPKGEEWDRVDWSAGAFSKPCCYVGAVFWGWQGETITHLELETDTFDLVDDGFALRRTDERKNRPEDIAWATKKIKWLFRQAKIECPAIVVSKIPEKDV